MFIDNTQYSANMQYGISSSNQREGQSYSKNQNFDLMSHLRDKASKYAYLYSRDCEDLTINELTDAVYEHLSSISISSQAWMALSKISKDAADEVFSNYLKKAATISQEYTVSVTMAASEQGIAVNKSNNADESFNTDNAVSVHDGVVVERKRRRRAYTLNG